MKVEKTSNNGRGLILALSARRDEPSTATMPYPKEVNIYDIVGKMHGYRGKYDV